MRRRDVKPELRRYFVSLTDRDVTVDAHYAFMNPGEGLVFRRYCDDNPDGEL